jgi:hypothetical protein
VTTEVKVVKLIGARDMVELETVCRVGDKVVINGTATLLAPKKPAL